MFMLLASHVANSTLYNNKYNLTYTQIKSYSKVWMNLIDSDQFFQQPVFLLFVSVIGDNFLVTFLVPTIDYF